eukprot:1126497-Rhodomonas_salina.1
MSVAAATPPLGPYRRPATPSLGGYAPFVAWYRTGVGAVGGGTRPCLVSPGSAIRLLSTGHRA